MTEKRFQWVYIQGDVVQLRDNGMVKHFPSVRLEELLNALHEENIELKEYIQHIHRLYEDTHGINMENEEWWEDD